LSLWIHLHAQLVLKSIHAEWEAQRERFTYLYMVEDKKLSEVRETMAALYGFHPT
jgi:hypothetical protein